MAEKIGVVISKSGKRHTFKRGVTAEALLAHLNKVFGTGQLKDADGDVVLDSFGELLIGEYTYEAEAEAAVDQDFVEAVTTLSLQVMHIQEKINERDRPSCSPTIPMTPVEYGRNLRANCMLNNQIVPQPLTVDNASNIWPEYDQLFPGRESQRILEEGFKEWMKFIKTEKCNFMLVFEGRKAEMGKSMKKTDFYVVLKGKPVLPIFTACTVRLLSSDHLYNSDKDLGNLVQRMNSFLQVRNRVLVGLTDGRKCKWFLVERQHSGNLYVENSSEFGFRESMCAILTSQPENFLTSDPELFRPGKLEEQISRVLGTGRTSTVYLTLDEKGNKSALKIYKDGFNSQREVDMLKKLKGLPGIPSIVNEPSETKLRIMPVGECLAIAQGLKDHRKLFCNIVDVLRGVHEKKIVHRDIRPPNILLVGEGNDLSVFLIDWGFATNAGELVEFEGNSESASDSILCQLIFQQERTWLADDEQALAGKSLFAMEAGWQEGEGLADDVQALEGKSLFTMEAGWQEGKGLADDEQALEGKSVFAIEAGWQEGEGLANDEEGKIDEDEEGIIGDDESVRKDKSSRKAKRPRCLISLSPNRSSMVEGGSCREVRMEMVDAGTSNQAANAERESFVTSLAANAERDSSVTRSVTKSRDIKIPVKSSPSKRNIEAVKTPVKSSQSKRNIKAVKTPVKSSQSKTPVEGSQSRDIEGERAGKTGSQSNTSVKGSQNRSGSGQSNTKGKRSLDGDLCNVKRSLSGEVGSTKISIDSDSGGIGCAPKLKCVYEPQDDLVSLLRTLYLYTFKNECSKLRLIGSNKNYRKIREFWSRRIPTRPGWAAAQGYAEACDYERLKDFIGAWAQNYAA